MKQGEEVQVEYLSLMMKNANEDPASKLECYRSMNMVATMASVAAEAVRVKRKG